MKKEFPPPKGLEFFLNKHIGEYVEDESIKADFKNRLMEIEKEHPDFACTAPAFFDDLWDVVIGASIPISDSDPNLPESEWPGTIRDWKKVIDAARKLQELIGDEEERERLPGIGEHIDFIEELGYFIEDMETALKEAPIAKPEENRKVNAKNWKTDFAVEILALRFADHKYKQKYKKFITGVEGGVFVETARIVLHTANRIINENGGDSYVNTDAPDIAKKVLSRMRRTGQLL